MTENGIDPETVFLDYHSCTEEELGLYGSEHSKFYPILDEDLALLTLVKAEFLCFDQS